MSDTRSCARCGWLLLCALLFACSESPSTGVLVSIHAGDKVAQNLNRLQVLLYALEESDESKPVEDRLFSISAQPEDGEVAFLLSFLIQKGKAQSFRLVVKGYSDGRAEPVIERKLIASFRGGRTELLEVVLANVCYARSESCSALETCYPLDSEGIAAGHCGPIPVVDTQPVVPGREFDATIEQVEVTELDGGAEPDAEVERDTGPAPDVEASLGEAREDGSNGPDGGPNRVDGALGLDGCVAGQVSNGAGGCVADPCLTHPCQHGGRCDVVAGTFRCDCAGTGFEGDTCGRNIDECMGVNVCAGTRNDVAFTYPCQDHKDEQVGYSCPGMFSDWPLAIPADRFAESASGVMRDARTGLEWQVAIDTVDRTFADARSYCMNLPLAGGRFRLPTRAELDTITDMTTREGAAIDQRFFPRTPALAFWTSSPNVYRPGFYWVVDFFNGSFDSRASAGVAIRTRCVRSPPGAP